MEASAARAQAPASYFLPASVIAQRSLSFFRRAALLAVRFGNQAKTMQRLGQ
jgi:hypothetical protein